MKNWTTTDAATAWGVSRRRANILVQRIPGARREIVGRNVVWYIPADSPKPPAGKPGPRPKE